MIGHLWLDLQDNSGKSVAIIDLKRRGSDTAFPADAHRRCARRRSLGHVSREARAGLMRTAAALVAAPSVMIVGALPLHAERVITPVTATSAAAKGR